MELLKYDYDSEQMEALLKNALGISISDVEGADEMGRAHADIVYMDSVKIRQLAEMLLK